MICVPSSELIKHPEVLKELSKDDIKELKQQIIRSKNWWQALLDRREEIIRKDAEVLQSNHSHKTLVLNLDNRMELRRAIRFQDEAMCVIRRWENG